jgi:ABC-type branched-subunit amino acid transport system ATPase component
MGAGKSTLLKTIGGIASPATDTILLAGEQLARRPAAEITRRGISYVPQGRGLFARMSVAENMELGRLRRRKQAGTTSISHLSDRAVALERGQIMHIGPSKALSEDLDLCRKVLWLRARGILKRASRRPRPLQIGIGYGMVPGERRALKGGPQNPLVRRLQIRKVKE